MRKKPVFCSDCGHEHILQERQKPQDYSGMTYGTLCPKCNGESIVMTLNAYLKIKAARETNNA